MIPNLPFFIIMARISRKTQESLALALEEAKQVTYVGAFKPNAGGQEQFAVSKKHQQIFAGGNKSGKSYCGAMKALYRSVPERDAEGKETGWCLDPYFRVRYPGPGVTGWISTYSRPVQVETVQPLIFKFFEPYITSKVVKGGVCENFELLNGKTKIFFKIQEAGQPSYTGANLQWAWLDEPHDRAIYYEIVSRLAQTQGYMWTTLTPVVDAKDPNMVQKMKYIRWMKEELIDPFHADPRQVPEVEVIYVDIEENPFVDSDFALSMWASLSAKERLIRKSGRFFDYIGDTCFDSEHIETLDDFLHKNPDISEPEYGELMFSPDEDDPNDIIHFEPTTSDYPFDPTEGFIWRVWQRPVVDQFGIAPAYVIGVDPAEGKRGRDYTAAYVLRVDTGEEVAALHGYVDEIILAKQLWLAGHYYANRLEPDGDSVNGYRPARVAVESVGVGQVTLAYLMTGQPEIGLMKYGISNLYRQPDSTHLERGKMVMGNKPGWKTTPRTRPHLVTAMRRILGNSARALEQGDLPPIRDIGFLREARTFVRNQAGKFEAAVGFYDDRMFARAIAELLREHERDRSIGYELHRAEEPPRDLIIYQDGVPMWNVEEMKRRAGQGERPEIWY